jgi:hypothetical protein
VKSPKNLVSSLTAFLASSSILACSINWLAGDVVSSCFSFC